MSTLTVRSWVSQTLRAAGAERIAGASLPLVLLAFAGTAAAQTAPSVQGTGTLEEVVVTGIRKGVQDAVEVKRDAADIVEAVSAEDIGKLPDTSIADSISRLPGVTTQRAAGKSSAISIRGTDPAFTNGLLNGREQVSTGDNRDIEYDQYPSELISQVVVYKTPDAQLIGQGLAGTIDLRTVRPLDYGKTAFAVNVRGERNSNGDLGANSKQNGSRFSLSYIDQYADGKVGLAIGVARLDSPLATQGFGAYGPWHPNCPTYNNGCNDYNYHTSVPLGVYVTDGMKVRADMGDEKRTGALATLQFRPNANYTSTLDVYYTKSDTTDDARSLEWNLGNYPATTDYSNLNIVDNSLVGATVANVRPLVRNFQFITNDKIQSYGWNNKIKADAWTVDADLGWSRATRDQWQPETNAQLGNCTGAACFDTSTFAFSTDHMPTATLALGNAYSDPNQVAFGNTIYGLGWAKAFHVVDTLKSARVDVGHEGAGWFENFVGGINVTKRSKDKEDHEGGWNLIGNASSMFIDPQYLLAPTKLGYAGVPNALAWNVPAVLGAYFQPWQPLSLAGNPWLIGKNWSVDETVTTASVRGNLNHDLSPNVTLKGNVGLQFVHTQQSSSSFQAAPDPAHPGTTLVYPYTVGTNYNDVLPQFNLAFILPNQNAIRVGLAREMARPRMDQLKASIDEGIDQSGANPPGGSGGNPLLKPWRADALDLSWEKYFSTKGYVAAALFYKKLNTYIYNATDYTHDFSALIAQLGPNYFPPGTTPPTVGGLNMPLNGSGGRLDGIELSASLPGDLLSEATRDFGLLLSIAQTDSNITAFDPPAGSNSTIATNGLGTIPLPGLSKTVWNATLYYERAGFSTRIATRARSKYIGEITNFSNDRTFQYVKGNQITDFQMSYEWQDGPVKGLMILFQINNLTNEPYVSYQGSESRVMDYQTYGKQFLLGVNYKL
ncbi:MAG: TonB-dependent receptor [Proteobacteria bacterium]|nr:TonB-dependent receptor [Pseudomonadota bacterium]